MSDSGSNMQECFPDNDKEEDNFACQHGTHGQTIITHSNTHGWYSWFLLISLLTLETLITYRSTNNTFFYNELELF